MARRLALVVALLAAFGGSALAGDASAPNIPKAQGEPCVRDTAYMRRYHMVELLKQRDQTVHEGLRGGDFSIARCVTCHEVKGPDGKPVSYADPSHFCRSCHSYASVSIDCFECHNSKPGESLKAASAPGDADFATLKTYLSEAKP